MRLTASTCIGSPVSEGSLLMRALLAFDTIMVISLHGGEWRLMEANESEWRLMEAHGGELRLMEAVREAVREAIMESIHECTRPPFTW